jgi:glycosyltransferase involved in cell wall biosynthesis
MILRKDGGSLKVLYISGSIVPSKNANSVHVMKMCHAIANQGNEVTLIVSKGSDEEPFSYYNVGNNFQLIQTKVLKRINKISFIPRLCTGLKMANSFDFIYTRWLLIAAILLMLGKKNVIFEHHGMSSSYILSKLEKIVAKSKNVMRHIFITYGLRDDFLIKYEDLERGKILVLPDGADVCDSVQEKSTIHKVLNCGYIGSFKPGKGLEVILNLSQKMPTVEFHIVGGTEDEINKYKKMVMTKNITWYGYLGQKKAMQILDNEIDIALLPNQEKVLISGSSQKDIGKWTSPMKLFEYMSRGKAIIASDLPVLKEILEDKRNSLLVISDNIEDWTNAIKLLQNDLNLYQKISQNAKCDLDEKYSWEIRAKKALDGLII